MLELIAKLLKVLNAEVSSTQISLGFVTGMIVGLTPLWSLHNLLLLFLVFLIRVNLSAFFLSMGVFSGVAYLVDPMMNQVGVVLLTAASMQDFWTSLYNQPIWRLTHFNNTLTLGSFACATALAIPWFFISNILIKNYRHYVLAWVRKSKFVQLLKAGRLYRVYHAVAGGE